MNNHYRLLANNSLTTHIKNSLCNNLTSNYKLYSRKHFTNIKPLRTTICPDQRMTVMMMFDFDEGQAIAMVNNCY